MAISDLTGNCSSPLWYVWNTVEVRPLFCSKVLRAASRGTSENPPAAAPHRMPQDGTSLASTLQVLVAAFGTTWEGTGAAAWAVLALVWLVVVLCVCVVLGCCF